LTLTDALKMSKNVEKSFKFQREMGSERREKREAKGKEKL
jgi:hypothetical protein